ncbi:MAG TPA: hypothetical protein VGL02_05740, partial [Streptomyces sp.]
MSNPHDPRLHFSGRPKRPEPPEDEATFKLLDPGTGGLGPGPEADEPTRATVLDPDSWSSEAPYIAPVEAEPSMGTGTGAGTGTGGLRRFGPGVPGPNTS